MNDHLADMPIVGADPKARRPAGYGRLRVGDEVPERQLATIARTRVAVPDPRHRVHIQFRRFAGCPVCNLHLRSFVARQADIDAAEIVEVVVFHSTAEDLRIYENDLPFAVVADPRKLLYEEFGVEAGIHSLLDPRAVGPIARAVLRSLGTLVFERRAIPPVNPAGGRFGLPADFLIGCGGRIDACKYGEHVYDQWSVDELLDCASMAQKNAAGRGTGRAGDRL